MQQQTSPFQSGETFSPELEVTTVREGQPHVVILGAGASRAACPKGEANGRVLPLIDDLVNVVGLDSILSEYGVDCKDAENFEKLYSRLADQRQFDDCRAALEKRVQNYFSLLRLPDHPTLYDHLVLSLRPRDVIATFNWDPLLVQVAQRNSAHVALPRLLFLHGNVAVGYCEKDKRKGPYPGRCPKCHNLFQATHLLYPVSKKNYPEQHFIWDEWCDLRDALKDACILTIFGFGAPVTDVEAVDLLQTAWPSPKKQKAQWVELINTTPEDELRQQWSNFILSHHADTTNDFYQSRIARHPRRTGEAWAATHLFAMWEDGNPLPREADFPELGNWFEKLAEVERNLCHGDKCL